jgi:hypothetical protein
MSLSRPAALRQFHAGASQEAGELVFRQGVGNRRHFRIQKCLVHAATDDMHLAPMCERTPAVDLAAAEIAHRHDERCAFVLFFQRQRFGPIPLLRPMNRDAVVRPAEDLAKQRHDRRIGREVNVQMLGANRQVSGRKMPRSAGMV